MFKEILETIVTSCSGGAGAVLMGYDGIGIDQYSTEENALDLNLVGIEYSNVTKEIRSAAKILSIGALQEVSIKTANYYVIIHALTEEYFVALMIDRHGNYGQGRYLLMREAPALRKLLV
ncbi:MAG: roadblock/LC7 domain-containing protein [Desulfuromusa sp.]